MTCAVALSSLSDAREAAAFTGLTRSMASDGSSNVVSARTIEAR